MITRGSVRVLHGDHEIRRMGQGEGFGEIALLYPVMRTATVAATCETTLLRVRREAFLTAVRASPTVSAVAHAIAARLLDAGRSADN